MDILIGVILVQIVTLLIVALCIRYSEYDKNG